METEQKVRLKKLLHEEGAAKSVVSPLNVWSAFKRYGKEVFGREGIGLLFQVGTYSFTGKRLFYFDPICQFEVFDEDGEHDHFEQLHCELTCQPNETLEGIEANLWSYEYGTAEDFFAAVEALPEFQAAYSQPFYSLKVSHEEV